jgi:hypothetical protein
MYNIYKVRLYMVPYRYMVPILLGDVTCLRLDFRTAPRNDEGALSPFAIARRFAVSR